jgi:hypothetical protein
VLDEHVELLEGARVEQQVDSFPGGELAAACWAATRFSPPPALAILRRASSFSSISCMPSPPPIRS